MLQEPAAREISRFSAFSVELAWTDERDHRKYPSYSRLEPTNDFSLPQATQIGRYKRTPIAPAKIQEVSTFLDEGSEGEHQWS